MEKVLNLYEDRVVDFKPQRVVDCPSHPTTKMDKRFPQLRKHILYLKSILDKDADTGHQQVAIYNPFLNRRICVDMGMKELLNKLWESGVQTKMSCQDSLGEVWIYFGYEYGMEFYDIVGHYYSQFDKNLVDITLNEFKLRTCADNSGPILHIRFPPHHYPYVYLAFVSHIYTRSVST